MYMQKIIRIVALIAVFLIATNITYAETNLSSAIDLNIGDTSPIVFQLQKYLNSNGYIVNSISGQPGSIGYEVNDFGIKTKQALIQFQKDKGINPATGFFGSKTKAKIAEATNLKVVSVSTTTPGKVLGVQTSGSALQNGGGKILAVLSTGPAASLTDGYYYADNNTRDTRVDVPLSKFSFSMTGDIDSNTGVNVGYTSNNKDDKSYYYINEDYFVLDTDSVYHSLFQWNQTDSLQIPVGANVWMNPHARNIASEDPSSFWKVDGADKDFCKSINGSHQFICDFVMPSHSVDITFTHTVKKATLTIVKKVIDNEGHPSRLLAAGAGEVTASVVNNDFPYRHSLTSSVETSSVSDKFLLGSVYTVVAEASSEYVFVGYGDLNGPYDDEYNYDKPATLGSDTTIYTYFKKSPKKLTINFVVNTTKDIPGGKVNIYKTGQADDYCNNNCTKEIDADTTVALTAVPDKGYRVVWGGGIPSGETDISVDMDQDKTVNIKFVKQYQLTIGTFNEGGYSGSGIVSVDPENKDMMYDEGSIVSVTASPAKDSRFGQWFDESLVVLSASGNAPSSGITKTIAMDSNKSLKASFIKQYKIQTSITGRSSEGIELGEITGVQNGGLVDENSPVTLTAEPLLESFKNAKFKRWVSGPCEGSTNVDCSFTAKQNEMVVAKFTLGHVLTITINSPVGNGGGTVTGATSGDILDEGDQRILYSWQNQGYKFVGWAGDCDVSCSFGHSVTVTMGSKDISVTANFAKKTVAPKIKSKYQDNGKGDVTTTIDLRNRSYGSVKGFSWQSIGGLPAITSAPSVVIPKIPVIITPTPISVAISATLSSATATNPDSNSSASAYYEVYIITAIPSVGSKFVGFEGCTPTVPGGNVCEVIGGDTAAEITATFAEIPPTYTLIIDPVSQLPAGTYGSDRKYPGVIDEVVLSSPLDVALSTSSRLKPNIKTSQVFSSGTKITLTATALNSVYRGVWTNCPTTSADVVYASGNVCTFTIGKDVNPKYQFILNNYNLTTKTSGSGSGSVSGGTTKKDSSGLNIPVSITADSSIDVGAGVLASIVATPSTESMFTGWEGCDSSWSSTNINFCLITLNGNRMVNVNFEKKSLWSSNSTLTISTTPPPTLFLMTPSAISNPTSTLILNPSITSPSRSLPLVMPSVPTTVVGPFAPSYTPVVGPLQTAPKITAPTIISPTIIPPTTTPPTIIPPTTIDSIKTTIPITVEKCYYTKTSGISPPWIEIGCTDSMYLLWPSNYKKKVTTTSPTSRFEQINSIANALQVKQLEVKVL